MELVNSLKSHQNSAPTINNDFSVARAIVLDAPSIEALEKLMSSFRVAYSIDNDKFDLLKDLICTLEAVIFNSRKGNQLIHCPIIRYSTHILTIIIPLATHYRSSTGDYPLINQCNLIDFLCSIINLLDRESVENILEILVTLAKLASSYRCKIISTQVVEYLSGLMITLPFLSAYKVVRCSGMQLLVLLLKEKKVITEPKVMHILAAVTQQITNRQHLKSKVLFISCFGLSEMMGLCSDAMRRNIVPSTVMCKSLVQLLEVGFADTQLAGIAMRCLGLLTTGTDSQTQAVLEANFLPSLKQILEEYVLFSYEQASGEQEIDLIKEICWGISNVTAGTQAQIQTVIDAELFPVLIRLAGDPNYHLKIRTEPLWAISNATAKGTKEQITYLVNHGCIEALLSFLGVELRTSRIAVEGLLSIILCGYSKPLTPERSSTLISNRNDDHNAHTKRCKTVTDENLKLYLDNPFIQHAKHLGAVEKLQMLLHKLVCAMEDEKAVVDSVAYNAHLNSIHLPPSTEHIGVVTYQTAFDFTYPVLKHFRTSQLYQPRKLSDVCLNFVQTNVGSLFDIDTLDCYLPGDIQDKLADRITSTLLAKRIRTKKQKHDFVYFAKN